MPKIKDYDRNNFERNPVPIYETDPEVAGRVSAYIALPLDTTTLMEEMDILWWAKVHSEHGTWEDDEGYYRVYRVYIKHRHLLPMSDELKKADGFYLRRKLDKWDIISNNFWEVIHGKDAIIKRQKNTINELTDEVGKLWKERDEWRDEWKQSNGYIETINKLKVERGEYQSTNDKLREQIQNQATTNRNFMQVNDKNTELLEERDELEDELGVCRKIVEKRYKLIEDYKETIHIERINRAAEKDVINRKYIEDLRKKNATIEDMDSRLASRRGTIKQQRDTIEELKGQNIEDLHELYDLDKEETDRLKHVISARDLTIQSLTTMCQSSGSIRKDLTKTIDEHEVELGKKDEEIVVLNDRIINKALESQKLRTTIDGLMHANVGLEAELSARKVDSAVLMEVVGIVREWNSPSVVFAADAMKMMIPILEDYLGAPEGPPETPIDDGGINNEQR